MFGTVYRFFGILVIEDPIRGIITVTGVNTKDLFRDIEKIWKTTLVTKYVFDDVGTHKFSFYKFFAPDVFYTLETILSYKGKYTKTSVILDVMNGLKTNTWLESCFQDHPHILDFSQLSKLQRTPLEHQDLAIKDYDKKVPKMQLKGMLLAADPGAGKFIMINI